MSSNVFGAFSHDPPSPPATDKEYQNEPTPLPELPLEADFSDKTGLLLGPTMRFDGDSVSPPWNTPEADLCALLQRAELEHVEERVCNGSNGVFWGRIRQGDKIKSVYVRFDGPDVSSYVQWGNEYLLDPEKHDRLGRAAAAYEIVKACGSEDLVPPLVLRDINPVPLVSDAIREKIGSQLHVPAIEVDEQIGIAAILQWTPTNSDNFIEKWSRLGVDNKERWFNASDALRHSLYRAYAIDFLLGIEDRLLCSYLYNETTDRLVILNLSPSFPNPAITAQKYLDSRATGWGRKDAPGLEKVADSFPPTSWDIRRIFERLSDSNIEECLSTFTQIQECFSDEVISLSIRILAERQVPVECISGFLARLAYLRANTPGVLDRPFDLVRNVLVPVRRGYGSGDGILKNIVEFVETNMQQIAPEGFDFLSIMSA